MTIDDAPFQAVHLSYILHPISLLTIKKEVKMELTIIETSAYLELKKTAQHTVCENGFPGYYISSVRGVGYKFNK